MSDKSGRKKIYKIDTLSHLPWVQSDREKVWIKCFNWIQKQKKVQITEVYARSCVLKFYLNGKYWKLYLPYEDAGLVGCIILNEITYCWKEVLTTKQLIKILTA